MDTRNAPLRWLREHLDWQSDDCLIWPFGRTGMGYGAVYPKGDRQQMAHRWVCEQVHGPQPADRPWVAHSCGNGHKGCVNPRHLRWATPKENGEDRCAHGNAPRGEAHRGARLTESEVRQIRRLAGTLSLRQVAKQFGVTSGAVSAIRSGRTWSWLRDGPE
ncbi:hypothetical protein DJ019_02000 [Phenylobacterium kunshanense]|uniref:HNH nuclease domain-containing protein n=2 Tax=Phenylobacterium kunshanense TaxID=1445034 RepID=A0A328BQD4_9CAUL|nr:hypothetical protein DJ019_02000 [Phenylobacterium kunshanense]